MLQDIVNQLEVLNFANEFALFWNQSANSLNSISGAFNASTLLGIMNNVKNDASNNKTSLFTNKYPSLSNYKMGISVASNGYLLGKLQAAFPSDPDIQALNTTTFDPTQWVIDICQAFQFPAAGINCTDGMTLSQLFAVRPNTQVCV
jgi:hypothetical protein